MNVYDYVNSQLIKPAWMIYKGRDYQSILKDIRKFHEQSLVEIRRCQFRRIRKLLKHCYRNIRYYRNEWDKIGLKPSDIRSLEDMPKLPILTKHKIRSNYEDLFSYETNRSKLIVSGTGGTTDSPIIIKYDRERAKIKDAETHYFREWWEWNIGDKAAALWGAPQDIPNIQSLKYRIRNFLIDRQLTLFSSFLNDNTMEDYVGRLNRFRPAILQGYSNALFILAKYLIGHQVRICPPKSVIVTAEPCTEYQRKTIEHAFGSKVFSFYGAREAGYIGVECREHNGFHLNSYGLFVEFVKKGDSQICKNDEIGRIVFTDLYNYTMPLIRYEIGDLGIPSNADCKCGSPLPLMKFFAGRETDVFVTPSGSYVPGVSLCDRIITDYKSIKALQFIQNNIDSLHVKIVKGPEYSYRALELLYERLNDYFKGELSITREFVSEIPKTRSGKTLFCISNIGKQNLMK